MIKPVRTGGHGKRTIFEVCDRSTAGSNPGKGDAPAAPAGPSYHYSEKPGAVASRLAAHLHDRVTGFGLSVVYERAFGQETDKVDAGSPSYYDGNIDVRVGSSQGDIGVQVTHATTQQVPFDGPCDAADHCAETTLPDGSILRTGQVQAGRDMVVLTAEVHRPDGVVVRAQESNYPFGPQATAGMHGDQPLTLTQLTNLAEDTDFTF